MYMLNPPHQEAVFASQSLVLGRIGSKAAADSPSEAVAAPPAAQFADVQDQF